MNKKEQFIVQPGWMCDISPKSKRKAKKLAHKRIRQYEKKEEN